MPQLAPAQSVITLVDPKKLTIKQKPQQVQVLDARHLRRWLMKRPVALTAADLDQLVEIIDDPATWSPAPAADASVLMAQFNNLHAEVKSARFGRSLWALLFTAAFIGAGIAAFPLLIDFFMTLATTLVK